jgi:hypothetical protein
MNRSKLITGTILLVVAAVLGTLYFTLPSTNMIFMVGDKNMPYMPAIILAVIGVFILAGAGEKAEESKKEIVIDEEKAALNKRLETIAWGLYIIMLGGFAFLPDNTMPKGASSIGVGLLMLGLNLVRYLKGIKMSGFTTFLGVVSLVSGVMQLFGLHDLEGAVLVIILGAYLIVKPSIEKKQIFGKAEEE